ncbi:hypothetical protein KVR01_011953 [Diaporthe batatas]|uniref:uncharacterized protein n=1 Tax=Diaporthe batatas TaxID=748121 RepID=UPI001D051B9E|nr:uncharacterized protein KVR01_011953 [Diaporthe batatas]KAG8158192.1 hypothetical protein KVR01_011953 [Diaporthe batatas]
MAPDDRPQTTAPFAEAVKVEKLDSNTYRVHLHEDYCIGSVPNGGYTASCILAAGRLHLQSRSQPDAFTAHFEFPGRTAQGPAIITADDIKLGTQLSTLQLTLWQGGLQPTAPWITPGASRRTVLAYATLADLRGMSGISLETGWGASPAAALPGPTPDFGALLTGRSEAGAGDGFWEEQVTPPSKVFRSLQNWRFFLPRGGAIEPGFVDMWACRSNREPVTQAALAYLVDSFPYNIHMYLMSPELRALLQTPRGGEGGGGGGGGGDARAEDLHNKNEQRAELWFPTVVLNLEVKTALPEEGLDWFAVRVQSKVIKDGRFDTDVMVRDKNGEVVALSQTVSMIVSMERNTARKGAAKASL